MPDDEIGAGVDDGVRERDDVAAILPFVDLDARTDVCGSRAFRARMHRDDHDVRPCRGGAHEL